MHLASPLGGRRWGGAYRGNGGVSIAKGSDTEYHPSCHSTSRSHESPTTSPVKLPASNDQQRAVTPVSNDVKSLFGTSRSADLTCRFSTSLRTSSKLYQVVSRYLDASQRPVTTSHPNNYHISASSASFE